MPPSISILELAFLQTRARRIRRQRDGTIFVPATRSRSVGVPRNSLQGPGFAELDLRWSHDFLFKAKKEGPRMTAALDAFNVTNQVNYAGFVGNLSSPFFGEAVAAKPSRRLQCTIRFAF